MLPENDATIARRIRRIAGFGPARRAEHPGRFARRWEDRSRQSHVLDGTRFWRGWAHDDFVIARTPDHGPPWRTMNGRLMNADDAVEARRIVGGSRGGFRRAVVDPTHRAAGAQHGGEGGDPALHVGAVLNGVGAIQIGRKL